MSDLIEQYIQKDGFDWLKAYQGYIALKRNNNPAQAEKYFAKAVLSASHDQVAGVLAEIEQAYGKSADAAEKSSQWVKQRANDNDGPAWEQLGLEYARARNIPLAQDAYQTALKNSSGEEKARICYSAGRVYYDLAGSETGAKRGELFALSEKAYLESLSLSPANKDALNDLAFLYVEDLNQPDKALPYAEKAYNLSPSVAAVADTYAWTLAKLKRYDEAGGILSQVIQTQESLPPFHYHLGWVYEQTGQYDKAMQEYRKALDTANDKDPLRDLVKPAIERVRNKSVAP
jgi:tetratricopeptide (TPR) repeat protein